VTGGIPPKAGKAELRAAPGSYWFLPGCLSARAKLQKPEVIPEAESARSAHRKERAMGRGMGGPIDQ
jgi:hypothetical protein